MTALERINTYISCHPEAESSRVLGNLVQGLHSGGDFRLLDLYDLSYGEFKLALDVLQQWRLGRYTLPIEEAMALARGRGYQ